MKNIFGVSFFVNLANQFTLRFAVSAVKALNAKDAKFPQRTQSEHIKFCKEPK